jgi:hypothetical protein
MQIRASNDKLSLRHGVPFVKISLGKPILTQDLHAPFNGVEPQALLE